MPNRSTHVFFSKKLHPEIPTKVIDKVSKKMDAPAKTLGPGHRKVNHSTDPFRGDSMNIHKGDATLYMLSLEHIMLDEDPALASLVEQLEVAEKYKKKAQSPYYKRRK